MIDLRNASLLDFLPESIASDSDIIALSLAIDPELQSVGAAIVEAVILPNIANLADDILDELGWAFRLNRLQLWDIATAAQKAAILVNIFAIRKKSGTRFSVRRVFDLLNITGQTIVGQLVEWFEEGAAAYTYRIMLTADQISLSLSQILQVFELTHRFAPTRSKLSRLDVQADEVAPLYATPALTVGRQVTIPFGGP